MKVYLYIIILSGLFFSCKKDLENKRRLPYYWKRDLPGLYELESLEANGKEYIDHYRKFLGGKIFLRITHSTFHAPANYIVNIEFDDPYYVKWYSDSIDLGFCYWKTDPREGFANLLDRAYGSYTLFKLRNDTIIDQDSLGVLLTMVAGSTAAFFETSKKKFKQTIPGAINYAPAIDLFNRPIIYKNQSPISITLNKIL